MKASKKLSCMSALLLSLGSTGLFADSLPIQILSAVETNTSISEATVIIQKNGSKSTLNATDEHGTANVNTEFADGEDSLVIVKKPGYSSFVAKCPCKGMTYALSPDMTNPVWLSIHIDPVKTLQEIKFVSPELKRDQWGKDIYFAAW